MLTMLQKRGSRFRGIYLCYGIAATVEPQYSGHSGSSLNGSGIADRLLLRVQTHYHNYIVEHIMNYEKRRFLLIIDFQLLSHYD